MSDVTRATPVRAAMRARQERISDGTFIPVSTGFTITQLRQMTRFEREVWAALIGEEVMDAICSEAGVPH